MKKNHGWALLFILALAALAAAFCFPGAVNRGIAAVNAKLPFAIPPMAEKPFNLGLDVKGGVRLEYQADLNQIAEDDRAEVIAWI